MDNDLITWFILNNFKINQNKAYGIINNYEVNFLVNYQKKLKNKFVVYGSISFFADQFDKVEIISEINQLKIAYSTFEITNYGITWGISVPKDKQAIPIIEENLFKIIDIINAKLHLGKCYCPVCGEKYQESEFKLGKFDYFSINICQKCINTNNVTISNENKIIKYDVNANNYGRGILGLFIGSLFGVIVAFLNFLMGFMSGLASFVSLYVSILFYQKFRGKENFLMIILAILVTAIMQILFIVLIYYAQYILGISYLTISEFEDCLVFTSIISTIGIIPEGLFLYYYFFRKKKKKIQKL